MSGSDFRLGLTSLKRTPGARHEFSFEAAFGEAVDTGLVCLPGAQPVMVEGVMESVGDGVLVTANAAVTLSAQCSRCLTQFSLPVEVSLRELFIYPEHGQEYEDEDVSFIHEESVDLESALRDEIILGQPLIQLCKPDCLGLCPVCGLDRNADPAHSHDEAIDTRWLSLSQWGKLS